MKFCVLLEGEGEGCDYTIGCNKTWYHFDAADWEEARKIVKEKWGYHGEVKKAIIHEIAETHQMTDGENLENVPSKPERPKPHLFTKGKD